MTAPGVRNSSLAGSSGTRRVRSPPENFIYAGNDAVYRLQGTFGDAKADQRRQRSHNRHAHGENSLKKPMI